MAAQKADDEDLERQQPGGGINSKVLVGVGAFLILAAIIILIVVLTKT